VVLGLLLLVLVVAGIVMHFISEGALIEGVRQLRWRKSLTVREGVREGWGHAGALFAIVVIYFAVSAGSVLLLAAPCLIAAQLIGWPAAVVVLGIPAALIAVPWLVTLYIWQAFAARIAVLENRRPLDAIGKARLFLHGRLLEGLKCVVAAFLGTLAIVALGLIVIVPVALLVGASFELGGIAFAAVLGALVLAPVAVVLVALIGTFQSSVWTIAYLSQVEG
jgi:hypothetical protein